MPIAVSIGEPAGIGPDVIIDAWMQCSNSNNPLPPFYVIGDAAMMRVRAKRLGISIVVEECSPGDATGLFPDALPVSPLLNRFTGLPGSPDPADAFGVIKAIETGVSDVFKNRARALVTAPINKECLYRAGFKHPGHTEFLAALAADLWGGHHQPVMMIAGDSLRTIPITIHIPLHEVPKRLSRELIIETGMIAATDLRQRFGISNPRLVFAGLNPHAGENGTMGVEDQEIIQPAVEELCRRGIDAKGPLPADTLFHAAARTQYDVALCMYHDQALIPAKTLAFDSAVNVTLGLPFVRTSPDHGTAFDIAGTGKANPASMIAAIRLADKMASAKQAGN